MVRVDLNECTFSSIVHVQKINYNDKLLLVNSNKLWTKETMTVNFH
jgi:hypothetical protein